jgi:RNase H-fold protein (predicted Holliday junction resolvase)
VILIQFTVLAVDPGKFKCGLAVVTNQGIVFEKSIIRLPDLKGAVIMLSNRFLISAIVLGDRTNSKTIHFSLATEVGVPIVLVDEDKSSLEGRYRYLKENTRGLSKILPLSLRIPRQPYDDYVAVILAERFFKKYPNFHPG